MNDIEILIKENELDKADVECIVSVLVSSFSSRGHTGKLYGHEMFLEQFSTITNRLIQNNEFAEKKDKLKLIHVADKLNRLIELSAIQKGKVSENDIQQAGLHLGKKAQSAFG